jgi:hypothetical protein
MIVAPYGSGASSTATLESVVEGDIGTGVSARPGRGVAAGITLKLIKSQWM